MIEDIFEISTTDFIIIYFLVIIGGCVAALITNEIVHKTVKSKDEGNKNGKD